MSEEIIMKSDESAPQGLLPVQNVREQFPHVCAFCTCGSYDDDGGFFCDRPYGPWLAAEEGKQYYTTCDGFTASENS